MFTHKIDKLVQDQLDALKSDHKLLEADNLALRHEVEILRNSCKANTGENIQMGQDLIAIEQKLDELLKAQDASARSIPGEKPAPEAPNVMPGHIPWSQRKRAREQASRSPNFIDKVKKGAATTEKPEEVKSE